MKFNRKIVVGIFLTTLCHLSFGEFSFTFSQFLLEIQNNQDSRFETVKQDER